MIPLVIAIVILAIAIIYFVEKNKKVIQTATGSINQDVSRITDALQNPNTVQTTQNIRDISDNTLLLEKNIADLIGEQQRRQDAKKIKMPNFTF